MPASYPVNFDPKLRRAIDGGGAQPITAPIANDGVTTTVPDMGQAPTPLTADQQVAAFNQAHPFAPAGSFTPTQAPAPAPGLYASGVPAGAEVASSDPYAGERGAGEALAMQAMTAPGLYAPPGYPGGEVDARQAARASVVTPAASPGAGGRGGARSAGGGDSGFGLEADASGLSPVLSAALGLQQLKQQAVAGDVMANMASAGALISATDTPEIRSRKLQYMEKRLGDVATGNARAPGTPMYTGDLQPGQAGRMEFNGRTYAGGPGGIPTALDLARTSTEVPNLNGPVGATVRPQAPAQAMDKRSTAADLATLAQQLQQRSRGPRLTTLGKDSRGNVVEGIQDPNGNFSRIAAPREGQGTQLNQLYEERDAAAAAGLAERVARYDEAIANWNQQYDIAGNPIGSKGKTGSTLSPADEQMLKVARANPNDERSKAILKRLGLEK